MWEVVIRCYTQLECDECLRHASLVSLTVFEQVYVVNHHF